MAYRGRGRGRHSWSRGPQPMAPSDRTWHLAAAEPPSAGLKTSTYWLPKESQEKRWWVEMLTRQLCTGVGGGQSWDPFRPVQDLHICSGSQAAAPQATLPAVGSSATYTRQSSSKLVLRSRVAQKELLTGQKAEKQSIPPQKDQPVPLARQSAFQSRPAAAQPNQTSKGYPSHQQCPCAATRQSSSQSSPAVAQVVQTRKGISTHGQSSTVAAIASNRAVPAVSAACNLYEGGILQATKSGLRVCGKTSIPRAATILTNTARPAVSAAGGSSHRGVLQGTQPQPRVPGKSSIARAAARPPKRTWQRQGEETADDNKQSVPPAARAAAKMAPIGRISGVHTALQNAETLQRQPQSPKFARRQRNQLVRLSSASIMRSPLLLLRSGTQPICAQPPVAYRSANLIPQFALSKGDSTSGKCALQIPKTSCFYNVMRALWVSGPDTLYPLLQQDGMMGVVKSASAFLGTVHSSVGPSHGCQTSRQPGVAVSDILW